MIEVNDSFVTILEKDKIRGKIIKFWNTNCEPCEKFSSKFLEAEKIFGREIDFLSCHAGNNFFLPAKFLVTSYPTVVLLKNGINAYEFTGNIEMGKFIEIIKNVFCSDKNDML